MKKISIFMSLFLGTFLIFTACKNDKANSQKDVEEANTDMTAKSVNPEDIAGDTYRIDGSNSKVTWEATKVGGKHNGAISVKDGFVKVDGGNITGGVITLDMNSIFVMDQEGEWKEKLEAHLKGKAEGKEDHFFNVAKFPTATFTISKVGEVASEGEKSKMTVYGDLTMKGITKPVSFMAVKLQEGNTIVVQSDRITLNRTDWGINYNSKSIFPNLKDGIIHDNIYIQFEFKSQS